MQRKTSQLRPSPKFFAQLLAILAIVGSSAVLNAKDVALTWSDNSDNEDGFTIERAIGEGEFEALAQVGVDIETYTDTTAEAGVDYRYRVNAFNAFGVSGYTNVATHYINVAPVLTALSDVSVEENETAEALALTVSDFETPGAELNVSVSSSNAALIGDSDIVIEGDSGERTLSLTPKLNAAGESTITVTVSDGVDSSSETFVFAVNPFVFPTLQLSLNSIAETPRAGETFLMEASASDSSVISAVHYWLAGELIDSVSAPPYQSSFEISEAGTFTVTAIADIVGREQTVEVETLVSVGPAPAANEIVENLATLSVDEASSSGTASYDLATDSFQLEDELGLIAGTSDTHRYYYLRAQGNVSIQAKIASLDAASAGSVAGLMVRSALFGNSAQASLLMDGGSDLIVRTRAAKGDTTDELRVLVSVPANPWVRIDRIGSIVSYYTRTSDAEEWVLLHEDTLDLGSPVFLGFALAGGDISGVASASFTGARLEGEILAPGEGATKPSVPSGLLISTISK